MRLMIGKLTTLLFVVLVPTPLLAQVIPDDPAFPQQWSLLNTGQVVNGAVGLAGADINAPMAWAKYQGDRSTILAIVGSGVSPVADLQDRLLPGQATIGDLFDSRDTCGFGTRAASIAGAGLNDATGIAGICSLCSLLPIRVSQGCLSTASSVAAGIRQAVDQRAKVILVAIQLQKGSTALAEAVSYAASNDVLLVAPAGDVFVNLVFFPAAYSEVIAVSATNNLDQFSSFSNFGSEVELSAPGEDIIATHYDGSTVVKDRAESLAAAHVAGVAALMRAFAPQLTASQTRQILIDSSDDLGVVGWDSQFGYGRLNARAAMTQTPSPSFRFELVDALPQMIDPGENHTFVISIVDETASADPGTVSLYYRVVPGAFISSPVTPLGNSTYLVSLPASPCGSTLEYYLSAAGVGGVNVRNPLDAPAHVHSVIVTKREIVLADDFETDQGWSATSAGGAGTKGDWVRVAPVGTSAQPGFDASPGDKSTCYITGQHFGGSAGTGDVDGGPVQLVSPIAQTDAPDALIRYWVWFQSLGDGLADTLQVELSRDAGNTWTLVETITNTLGWEPRQFALSDFPQMVGSDIQLRFTTADLTNDSLTEAGIDEIKIEAILCVPTSADFDGNGTVDAADASALASCILGPNAAPSSTICLSLDFDTDVDLDLFDWHAWVTQFGD